MAGQDGGSFRFITVNDDEEELVVHAGSGKSPTPIASAAEAALETASRDSQSVQQAPQRRNDPQSARQEELRRRAEELAQAEEGLEDPHTFSRMRTIVLLALAALVIAFVAYLLAMNH